MSSVAIIPARGGSKRIPKKNIKPFAGKPMIAHSIETALKSDLFDQVVVSTDSEEVAAVATKWGAEVPFMRPKDLANDTAGTDEVFLHALEWLCKNGGNYDTACLLYATAPFIQIKFLKDGIKILKQHKTTSAFSVTTFPFPIFRGLKINQEVKLKMLWPEHRMTRSQDLPETYHDAGQFYWVDIERFFQVPDLYADAAPVIIPRKFVQDIDTPEDWERAELMWKVL